jgi:hypothetical protein
VSRKPSRNAAARRLLKKAMAHIPEFQREAEFAVAEIDRLRQPAGDGPTGVVIDGRIEGDEIITEAD